MRRRPRKSAIASPVPQTLARTPRWSAKGLPNRGPAPDAGHLGDTEPGSRFRFGLSLDSYFDIAPQQEQKAHQTLDREPGQLTLLQRGDFRLVDTQYFRS